MCTNDKWTPIVQTSGADVWSSRKNSEKPYRGWSSTSEGVAVKLCIAASWSRVLQRDEKEAGTSKIIIIIIIMRIILYRITYQS